LNRTWPEEDSRQYTRWLATRHYEKFSRRQLSPSQAPPPGFLQRLRLLPLGRRSGDETGDVNESLRLLTWWRTELYAMYAGRASHPVFVALKTTATRRQLPINGSTI